MAKTLTEAIQDLPPELFNQIRSTVLACPCGQNEHNQGDPLAIHITTEYEFPNELHIDTFTRQDFARHYYRNATLVFTSWKIFEKFRAVIGEEHLELLAGIHLIHGNEPRAPKVNALRLDFPPNKNPVKEQKARCAGIYFTCGEQISVFGIDIVLAFR